MAIWSQTQESDADKLPSVNQWIKTVSSEALEPVRLVKMIWTPNLYDNYSLDTEAFRVRIKPKDLLFEILEANLNDWMESDVVLAIKIEGRKIPRITLMTLDSEKCDWDSLGDYGWKMSNLKSRVKNVSSKTRLKQSTLPSEPGDPEKLLEDLS